MARKPAARCRVKVDSAGRVLIPVPLGQKFGVQPGETVGITEGRGGQIVQRRNLVPRPRWWLTEEPVSSPKRLSDF